MSVRETLELDVSPALQALQQFGSRLEGVARGFGDDLQQALESALQGLPVVDVKADATSVTQEVDQALAAADGEKEVDGDATAVESSVTEAVAAADGTKEVDGDAIGVESAITEAVGAADGVKEITADASGVTEAIEQAVADADVDLSVSPVAPGADGGAGATGLAAGLALAKTNADSLAGSLGAAGGAAGRLGAVGGRAMTALTTPAVAAGVAVGALGAIAVTSVRQFANLQQGIAEVVTLLGDVPDSEVQRLTDGVRQLSGEMGIAATEIVPALYNAISAGVPAENAFEFLRTASEASIAGVTTLNTSVNGLTTIVNAFGLSFAETEMVADSMFAAVQGGKTTFDELSRSIFQIAPAAAASGVSIQEVNASLATLTASGVPTRVASTQLRAALVGLQRPSEELDAVFQDLGYQNAELAIRQEGLVFALGAVVDASGGSAGALQQYLGSVEAVAAANVLANTNAQKFSDEMVRQQEATGATGDAFDTMSDTLNFSMSRIREAIDDVRYGIGQALLPTATKLIDGFEQLAVSAGPLIVDVFEPLAAVLNTVVTSIAGVISVAANLPSPIRNAALAVGALTVAMRLNAVAAITNMASALGSLVTGALAALRANAGTAAASIRTGLVNGLRSVPVAAGLAVGALTLLGEIIASTQRAAAEARFRDLAADIKDIQVAVVELGTTGLLTGVFADLDLLTQAFVDIRTEADGAYNFLVRPRIGNGLGPISSWLTDVDDNAREARERIEEMDEALTNVLDLDPDIAINAFEQIRDTLIENGATAEEVDEQFDGFRTRLETITNVSPATRDALAGMGIEVAALGTQFVDAYNELARFAESVSSNTPTLVEALGQINEETSADELTGNLRAQIDATNQWTADMTDLYARGFDDISMLLAEVGPTQSAMLLTEYRGREQELENHLEEMAAAQQRAAAKANEIALRGYLEMNGITERMANVVVMTLGAELQLGVPAQEAIDAVVNAPATQELAAMEEWGDFGRAVDSSVTDIVNEEQGKAIAENLDRGLGDGLSKEQAQAVWRAAIYAQRVKDKINEIFGIKSPSTEMMDTGRNLVLGLTMGIDRNTGLVDSAMNDLGRSVLGVSLSAGGPTIRDVSVTVPVTVSGGMSAEDGRAVGQAAGQAAAAELARMMRLEAMVA